MQYACVCGDVGVCPLKTSLPLVAFRVPDRAPQGGRVASWPCGALFAVGFRRSPWWPRWTLFAQNVLGGRQYPYRPRRFSRAEGGREFSWRPWNVLRALDMLEGRRSCQAMRWQFVVPQVGVVSIHRVFLGSWGCRRRTLECLFACQFLT